MNLDRIETAHHRLAEKLLALRCADGSWRGHLSSSALSTATAVSALSVASQYQDRPLIEDGIRWLRQTQNDDGGWGDTTDSPSNLSTSLLVKAAMQLGRGAEDADRVSSRLEGYLTRVAGASVDDRRRAVCAAYDPDRTFAVPILTNLALAGLLPWRDIPPLPFELAALPSGFFKFLRLHVVSYALPALIAVGLMLRERQQHPFWRWLTPAFKDRCLKKLEVIQPEGGGFLEAVPLTSFVAMSLVPVVGPGHPVVAKGIGFLRRSVRPDGSWPIDSDLSVWVTTASVVALSERAAIPEVALTREWLLGSQHLQRHPYTDAAPGAWAWTHRDGGVPDADDTAGAILALASMGEKGPAMDAAIAWLLDLQNRDGGWPTFCRGWGHLPFDRSTPDITAHVLRALEAGGCQSSRCALARHRGIEYLHRQMSDEGAWIPLWFGSQRAPDHANRVVGTSRVLRALALLEPQGESMARGARFLLRAQNPDGGWGAGPGIASTVEESALAVSAIAGLPGKETQVAVERGALFLAERTLPDDGLRPAPIGLYFARLWYSEEAYPLIWAVEALGRVLTQTGVPQTLSPRKMASVPVPSGG